VQNHQHCTKQQQQQCETTNAYKMSRENLYCHRAKTIHQQTDSPRHKQVMRHKFSSRCLTEGDSNSKGAHLSLFIKYEKLTAPLVIPVTLQEAQNQYRQPEDVMCCVSQRGPSVQPRPPARARAHELSPATIQPHSPSRLFY